MVRHNAMRSKVAGAVVVLGLLVPSPALGATRVERHHRCQEECDGGGPSGGEYGGGHSGDDHGGDGSCRNFCNITVPTPPMPGQPKGFIPPNPGKIPQQIADFFKVVSDFVQAVIKFAV